MRKYLTAKEVAKHGDAITRVAEGMAPVWGAEAIRFVGKPPRVRLAVQVAAKHPDAPNKVTAIPLPAPLRGRLKPMVVASHSGRSRLRRSDAFAGLEATAPALAPGTPILVGSAGRRGSFAAVAKRNGELFLVTCGHLFESQAEQVFAVGDDLPVASLTESYLDSAPRLDGALCRVTVHGRELLAQSGGAATWTRNVHQPQASDHELPAVFFPTHEDDLAPEEEDITSSSGCTEFDFLFGGAGPQCGFVVLGSATRPGDSGSLLMFGDAAYALCTGHIDNVSYMTPIAAVLARASVAANSEVVLWHPDDGISG